MSENMKNISNTAEVQNAPEMQEAQFQKFTLDYCLEQMEQIRLQTEYLNNVIAELSKITTAGPGDICGSERAQALGDVVKCRETTNQKLIAFYEKMYDDLKPAKATLTKEELVGRLNESLTISFLPDDVRLILAETISQKMKEL